MKPIETIFSAVEAYTWNQPHLALDLLQQYRVWRRSSGRDPAPDIPNGAMRGCDSIADELEEILLCLPPRRRRITRT